MLGFYTRSPRRSFAGFNYPFDDVLKAFDARLQRPSAEAARVPFAHIADTGEGYRVELRVPGLAEGDFKVTLSGETLTVRGERKVEGLEGYNVHRRERKEGRFAQSFTFEEAIDAENVTANLEHGVLTIALPKSPELRPRVIPVTGK